MNFRISQLSLRLVIEKNRVQRGFFVDKLWPMAALGLLSRRKISNIASVTPEVHYLIKLQPPSYAGRKKEPRYFLDIEITGLLERRLRAANLDSATFSFPLFFFNFIFKNAVEQTGSTRFRARGSYLCRSMTILGEVLIIGQSPREVKGCAIKDKCVVKQDVRYIGKCNSAQRESYCKRILVLGKSLFYTNRGTIRAKFIPAYSSSKCK